MPAKPAGGSVIRLAMEDLLEKDRKEYWREEIGRNVIAVDYEQLSDIPLNCSIEIRRLPGLSIVTSFSDGHRIVRTSRHIASEDDQLVLGIMSEGSAHATQLGHDAAVGPGEAFLLSSSDLGTMVFPDAVEFTSSAIPRAALKTLVADPEAALLKPIPKENDALRLLKGYLSTFQAQMKSVLGAPLDHVFAGHIQDLVALALGATREGSEIARSGGLRAARLAAVKTDIMHNLTNPALSVAFVAARQGVTPRYVQMLFKTSGVTFSKYVMVQRLALVLRRLTDPRFAHRTITDIAFEAGFGDSSHFNRAFRQRYGATPSEVRAEALRGGREND